MVRLSLELRKKDDHHASFQRLYSPRNSSTVARCRYFCQLTCLLRKYCEKSILIDIPRRSRQRKITPEMRVVIEEMYNENGELTSTRIKSLLTKGGQICRCQMYVKRNWLAVHETSLFQLLVPVSVSCCNYLL